MIRKVLAILAIAILAAVGMLVGATPAGATAPFGDSSHLYILTNNDRAANGRPWLAWDQNLANTAQDHANWMAATGAFQHDGNLYNEAAAAVPGLSAWGENIAYTNGSSDPIPLMEQMYMGSAGHRNNILGTQYDRVGIGVVRVGSKTYSVVRFAASGNKSALGTPVGNFEKVSSPGINQVRVEGWAIDPDTTGGVLLDVKVNGVLAAQTWANTSRSDIGNAYKGFGNNHGLNFTLSTIGGSTKSVCLEARNVWGYGVTQPLGCRNVYVTPDLSGPFYDVSSTHPFATEISWLDDSGITSGYQDGTFRPDDSITREAMAMFLWRYAGEPAPAKGAPTFSDVPSTSQFYTAIRWMAGEGITSGYTDGTFRPRNVLSRQAAAAFLWQYANQPAVPRNAPTFKDVGSTHPFVTQIRWMAGVGITDGYPDGTFRPSKTLSRQAMAAFLYRFDQLYG